VPDRPTNLDLLSRSAFFSGAGETAMARLLRPSFTQILPRNTVLFEQGETPGFLYLLLEGSIGLQARAGTAETFVEIFSAGELFLAPAAVLNLPYLASAVALTEVRVLMIPAETFRQGIAEDLALARASVELLARHWRLMVDQVVDLKVRGAEQRLARFLARRTPDVEGKTHAELPEPRSAIAGRLGMTPETLSRALASLEAQGMIRVEARRIIVPDRAQLIRSLGSPV